MPAVGVAIVVTYAWWATGLAPFSSAATAAVLVPGVGAVIAGHRRRRRERRTGPVAGIAGWLVLAAVVVVWELLAYVQTPRSEHPTLSSLVNDALDSHPARAAAFVGWLAGGFGLARR